MHVHLIVLTFYFLSVCLFAHHFVYWFICLHFLIFHICLFVYLFVIMSMSVLLSICPPICVLPFLHFSVCPFNSFSPYSFLIQLKIELFSNKLFSPRKIIFCYSLNVIKVYKFSLNTR